ncbi:MAG: efflux RND transporter permease subunit [Candidatus Muirbacterium halophilum]|nr:efflux RND transporter permease subunit [Candidatus Muirbacterium halophilum]MCK9475153.1 efflux RND transporter permease subunit [Candidatus Muirbacterium halophilum]
MLRLFKILFQNKPRLIPVIFLIIILFGVISFFSLKIEYLSGEGSSSLTVIVKAGGLQIEEIEKEICNVLESEFRKIPYINEIYSDISRGNLKINLIVESIEKKDYCYNRVSAVCDENFKSFPQNVSRPVILRYSQDEMPVIVFSFEKDGSREELEEYWGKKAGRIDGVAKIEIAGIRNEKHEIIISKDKMDILGINIADITKTVSESGYQFSITGLENTYTIDPLVENEQDILELPVLNMEGKAYYLKDIAEIKKTLQNTDKKTRVDGKHTKTGFVFRESGANIVTLCSDIKKEFKNENVDFLYDQGDFILESIESVIFSILVGLIISILFIMFFFRRFSLVIPVFLVIPISFLCSFIFMYFNKISLNVMSLSAFLFSTGLLYDNSIIIIEHFERITNEKKKLSFRLLFVNTIKIMKPLFISTLTTFFVFIPVFFLEESVFSIYRDFVLVLSFSLFASYIVACITVPYFISFFGIKKINIPVFKKFEIFNGILLSKTLIHRKLILFLCIILVFSAILLNTKIGSSAFSDTPDNMFILIFQPGLKLDKDLFDNNMIIIEKKLSEHSNVQKVLSTFSDEYARIVIRLKETSIKTIMESYEYVNEIMKNYPDIFMYISNAPKEGFNQADIYIYGNTFDERIKNAEYIGVKLKKEYKDIINQVIIREKAPLDEVNIVINYEKSILSGFSAMEVAQYIRAYIEGPRIKRAEFEEIDDLKIRLSGNFDLEQIKNLPLRKEKKVALKEIADIHIEKKPQSIRHINGNAAVTLTVIYTDNDVSDISKKITDIINNSNRKINWEKGKNIKSVLKQRKIMAQTLIWTLLLMFTVLFMYYEKIWDVILVFSVIPVSYSLIIFLMYIMGVTWSLPVYIAFILISGIIVNNSIYIIDLLSKEKTPSMFFKIFNSVNSRFRAVIITTGTTLCGIMPLLFAGSFWMIMGITAITGILGGMLISLYILPAMYYIINK